MPRGPQGQQRPGHPVGVAVTVAKIATGEIEEPVAAPRQQAAGRAGGPARAKALSPERRSEIARQAAQARWAKTA